MDPGTVPVGAGHVEVPFSYWVGFFALVGVLLAFDLFVHRKAKLIAPRAALSWAAFWIFLAVVFGGWIYFRFGSEKALEFATGYIIEEALSVDNLFVFMVIFRYFQVKPEHQHRVLFWGILGAIVMRLGFVVMGVELIERFHWVIYLLGTFLVYAGVKLLVHKDTQVDPEKNLALKLFRRYIPTTSEFEGPSFLVRRGGRLLATPLVPVLVVVETTDVFFAVDSVPAILAITTDTFIVFTSNVFAILGLRSLFFVLSSFMEAFRFLNIGLSLVLIFVGTKMVLQDVELDLGRTNRDDRFWPRGGGFPPSPGRPKSWDQIFESMTNTGGKNSNKYFLEISDCSTND